MITLTRYLSVFGMSSLANFAFAAGVTWEEQAERLQNVNASFLDSVPFGDPYTTTENAVGLRAVVTYLPKVNPRVGGKSEDVPSAPAHLIPIIEYSRRLFANELFRKVVAVHAGFLPAGGEKLLGLSASLTQAIFGATAQFDFLSVGTSYFYIPLGFQYSSATVTGHITQKDSDDEFSAETQLISTGVGYGDTTSGYFAGVQIVSKSTLSQFDIGVDHTSLKITDKLSDAKVPLAIQINAGMQITEALRTGYAYLWEPERLNTGRVLLSYSKNF